jgi:hypothetical protein
VFATGIILMLYMMMDDVMNYVGDRRGGHVTVSDAAAD